MIYITGDLHGEYADARLTMRTFQPEDYIIFCGDFGMIWDGSVKEQQYINTLSRSADGATILFVDGNHEAFPLINLYPQKEWNGGLIREITPKVFYLMRGQIFNIEGHTFFTMGGATSIDRAWRVPGVSWWPEEIPSQEEMDVALGNLETADWKVDYVLTHCAPDSIREELLSKTFNIKGADPITLFLQEIADKLDFKQWFFGHYHMNEVLQDGKYVELYRKMITIPEENKDEIQSKE